MNEHKIIDGDGHVMEDIATIWKYMPQEYVGKNFFLYAGTEKAHFPRLTISIPPTVTSHRKARSPMSVAKVGNFSWKK